MRATSRTRAPSRPGRHPALGRTALAALWLLTGCVAAAPAPIGPAAAEIPRLEARLAAGGDLDTRLRLGAAYRNAGRLDEAAAILRDALEIAPGDPQATVLLGLTYEEAGSPERARAVYAEYQRVGRSEGLKRRLAARSPLLERQELERTVRAAVAREAELAQTAPEPRTVAVFPFQYTGSEPELRPLGRALAEMLVTDLSQTGRLRVLERTGVQMLLDELHFAESDLVDPATAARSGRLLGAGRIVQGQIGGAQELLRLHAAVVGIPDGWDGRSLAEEDALARIFEMQKRLAVRIYGSLGVELTEEERQRVDRFATRNLRALLAFGECLEAEDAGDFRRASDLCARAARLDPGFGAAHERVQGLQAIAAATAQTPVQLAQLARQADGGHPDGLDAMDVFVPESDGRSPAPEVLGTEGLGRRAVLEIIIRRP
jgi:TolB-like protein